MRQPALAPPLPLLRKFPTEEATQGVAVDRDYFYAIDNARIGKYDRATGRKVRTYQGAPERPLIHMDGGMVRGTVLHCSHSNFPETPMLSSIESFDTRSLTHLASQSFGLDAGSLTWMDWFEGAWWVCFGHYNGKGGEPGKTNQASVLVRYDSQWRKLGGYVFPAALVARWDGMTASGGVWGPNRTLLVTGHHAPEIYQLRLPRVGSVLEIVQIIASPIEGQGIALDSARKRLFQIQRKERAVYEFDLAPLYRL